MNNANALSVSSKSLPDGYSLEIGGCAAIADIATACRYGGLHTHLERRTLGTRLWEATFDSKRRKELRDAIQKPRASGVRPRLLLSFSSAEVEGLDWESLYDPERGRFLVEVVEINRSVLPTASPKRAPLQLPLTVDFFILGRNAWPQIEIENFLNEALGSLRDTGLVGFRLGGQDSGDSARALLFHLIILEPLDPNHHAELPAWSGEPASKKPWSGVRRRLADDALGAVSLAVGMKPESGGATIRLLHERGWPIVARLDCCHGDHQEQLALRDYYFSLASNQETGAALGSVLQRQLAVDVHDTPRRRVIQLFALGGQPVFPFATSIAVADPLMRYLRWEVCAQERFYQWEKKWAELTFSTRLRLRKIDLASVQDLRSLPERDLALDEALGEFDRLVIIGEPGTGKTTACRRGSWDLAKEALRTLSSGGVNIPLRVPVYIELRGRSKGDTTGDTPIGDRIAERLSLTQPGLGPKTETLSAFLSEHRLVVLLDGLNEVSPPTRRRDVVDEILALKQQFGERLGLVVTSRKHDLDVARFVGGGFTVLEIMELSPADIRRFAACYLLDSASVDRFVASLTRPLKTAARNPLMLWLLLEEFKGSRSPIGSRAQLLRRFCRRALESPAEILEQPVATQVRMKEALLSKLAFALWTSGFRLRAPINECVDLVQAEFHSAKPLIQEAAANGILTLDLDEGGQELVEFRFQSYHEYFCARIIAREWMDGHNRAVGRLVRHDSWHEVIALAAGVIEAERKDGSHVSRSERDLIDFLKKKRQILLAGMSVWNMEKMNEELKAFEDWLVERARDAALVLSRMASVALFYLVFPLWLVSLFVVLAWAGSNEYYLWKLGPLRIGTGVLTSLVLYPLVPAFVYLAYQLFARRVAFGIENKVLRPTVGALYLIGSDYARGAVVDIFQDPGIPSRRVSPGERRIDGVSRDIGRRLLAQLRPFLPSEPYTAESLLELVTGGASDDSIAIVAKLVARDSGSAELRRLAQLCRQPDAALAKRARVAGNTLTKYNLELRSEWESLIRAPATQHSEQPKRRVVVLVLRAAWEWWRSSAPLDKLLAVGTLVLVAILIGSAHFQEWHLFWGTLSALAVRIFADPLVRRLGRGQ